MDLYRLSELDVRVLTYISNRRSPSEFWESAVGRATTFLIEGSDLTIYDIKGA